MDRPLQDFKHPQGLAHDVACVRFPIVLKHSRSQRNRVPPFVCLSVLAIVQERDVERDGRVKDEERAHEAGLDVGTGRGARAHGALCVHQLVREGGALAPARIEVDRKCKAARRPQDWRIG